MRELLSDPIFFGLIWAIFTVAGVIIGWWLRAAFPEKDVVRNLERTEHERNTLARLYTQLKHQYELREADFKRTSVELDAMRQQLRTIEEDKSMRIQADQSHLMQLQQAEQQARQYAERVKALEQVAHDLRLKNNGLSVELKRLHEELDAWQALYQDFQQLQHRLMAFEQRALVLEQERVQLREALDDARMEIDNLQLELVHYRALPAQKQTSATGDRRGGPAAPENSDDLKVINGVTPFAEQQLHAMGVHTFVQISRWDDEAIIAFAKALGLSPGKLYQDDWVGQARHLVATANLSKQ